MKEEPIITTFLSLTFSAILLASSGVLRVNTFSRSTPGIGSTLGLFQMINLTLAGFIKARLSKIQGLFEDHLVILLVFKDFTFMITTCSTFTVLSRKF